MDTKETNDTDPDFIPADGRRLPRKHFRRPRCPFCESTRLKITKSQESGDGCLTRWCRCRTCRRRVVIVLD